MVESSDEPSLLDRVRSIAHNAHASSRANRADDRRPVSPLKGPSEKTPAVTPPAAFDPVAAHNAHHGPAVGPAVGPAGHDTIQPDTAEKSVEALPPPAPPPPESGRGDESASIETTEPPDKANILIRFCRVCKHVMLATWLNVLLIFVPVGIAVEVAGASPNIIFAMNAIAIVPLAGLLSHATECVASEMGDTIGALMNVTFGNAVELIIFIALTKNEIRIVQASLLGSILANLLLILGMCFLFGGLRFREQIYNSVVTQMSACLLSLSVMSLLLPTAFHASFTDNSTADRAVLHVSRGTSIILLFVYVLYLLFQLKSHAYMYQSTPQHVIDEESHPGVLHDMLNSSSSSDGSSTSSGSDTDSSSGSVTTAKRIRRVLRGRRRRKSSTSSRDGFSGPSTLRTPSSNIINSGEHISLEPRNDVSGLGAIASGDEADTDGEHDIRSAGSRNTTINCRDFENEKQENGTKSPEVKTKKKSRRKHRKREASELEKERGSQAQPSIHSIEKAPETRVGMVQEYDAHTSNSPRRPFNIRNLTVRDVVPVMPPMPKVLSSTVFSSTNPTGPPMGPVSTTGITPRALHRSSSLPSRLNQVQAARQMSIPPSRTSPYVHPIDATNPVNIKDGAARKKKMSRTSAIILLLVSTGLVAVCAEFLVDSINYLVEHTSVSEAFIGLIILPIVGNAAEHVTAVTVAAKNKMDLAIGVAVGSSIQIALFVTPVIVLLAWCLHKDMSLYFSLFETISLFVSAFIVNFLVLDGRSNYLEGALLIAAYVIIAVAAFFYPDTDEQSNVGGGRGQEKMMLKRAVVDVLHKALVGTS